MFKVIVWQVPSMLPRLQAEFIVHSAENANLLAETISQTVHNVLVEILDKNEEVIKKFKRKA